MEVYGRKWTNPSGSAIPHLFPGYYGGLQETLPPMKVFSQSVADDKVKRERLRAGVGDHAYLVAQEHF